MNKGLEALDRIVKGYDKYYLKPNSKSSLKQDKEIIEKELKALELLKQMIKIKETSGLPIVVLKGNLQRVIVENKQDQDLLKEAFKNGTK